MSLKKETLMKFEMLNVVFSQSPILQVFKHRFWCWQQHSKIHENELLNSLFSRHGSTNSQKIYTFY